MLKIAENGEIYDVPIREGEVFMLPPHARHSPQRPVPGSIGLVVDGVRRESDIDGFEWFCFGCGSKVHRVEVRATDIVKDLPPLFEAFQHHCNDRSSPGRPVNHCNWFDIVELAAMAGHRFYLSTKGSIGLSVQIQM